MPTRNTYLRVTRPCHVYKLLGACDSGNTFVGSLQMLARLWEPLLLQPGDALLDLVGGVFALRQNETTAVEVCVRVSDKHPFEKTYTSGHDPGVPPAFRAEYGLVEYAPADTARDIRFSRGAKEILPRPRKAHTVGRNIDLVVAS